MVFWSAAPSTTDERCCVAEDDRHVPISDASRCKKFAQVLLEHLVGAGEQGWRHRDAELPSSLGVNRQLILGRRLNRKVGWFLTFEYAVNVGRHAPVLVEIVHTVRDQAAADSIVPKWVDSGNTMSHGVSDDLTAMYIGNLA